MTGQQPTPSAPTPQTGVSAGHSGEQPTPSAAAVETLALVLGDLSYRGQELTNPRAFALARFVLRSDWLAAHDAQVAQAARDDERAAIAKALLDRAHDVGRISVIRAASWADAAQFVREARGGAR